MLEIHVGESLGNAQPSHSKPAHVAVWFPDGTVIQVKAHHLVVEGTTEQIIGGIGDGLGGFIVKPHHTKCLRLKMEYEEATSGEWCPEEYERRKEKAR